ncbi:MAG: Gfo/Idh/MocA family oxidoreductase [DPANN group archaeon]|nr:Gfo/Idh/MocA family oxidoreductase [DPANN group archaeon]
MLNVGVIGIGNMGKHHARVYSELGANLVAVSDVNEVVGKEIASRFKCKFYKDYKEMLKNEKFDIVSVVVPNSFHKDVALACINSGVNVLVEKPIANTVEDAKEIIAAAKKANVKLAIGHIERFNPAVLKLKEVLQEGKLGNIVSIISRRVGLFPSQLKDANVVTDLAIHDIDVLSYLLGKNPKEVLFAKSGLALNNKREDFADIMLNFDPEIAFVQVNWITPVKIRNLCVTGTNGYAELNYATQELTLFESNFEKTFDNFGEFMIKFSAADAKPANIVKGEPLKLEIKNFMDCVEKNQNSYVSGEDGLRALEITLQALAKSKNV